MAEIKTSSTIIILIAVILGSFWYFIIDWKIEWEILSDSGLVLLYWGIIKFLTADEKNEFKVCAVFSSSVKIFSLYTKSIYSLYFILWENKDLTVL